MERRPGYPTTNQHWPRWLRFHLFLFLGRILLLVLMSPPFTVHSAPDVATYRNVCTERATCCGACPPVSMRLPHVANLLSHSLSERAGTLGHVGGICPGRWVMKMW